MHLLLINPNTTDAMTQRMAEMSRGLLGTGARVTAATGRFGGRYVASRAAYAIAGHAALDAYAVHGADADVVVLACFGDPGLLALKEIARQPVVGMAEASCLTASALGGRFAIVTGGERWGPMLEEFVRGLGMEARLAGIATVAPTGGEIAADPDRALDLLTRASVDCVERYRADSVILAGAGLAGLAERIADRVPVPLVDSLVASVRMAEGLARIGTRKGHVGSFARTPAVETVGLAPELARLFDGSA